MGLGVGYRSGREAKIGIPRWMNVFERRNGGKAVDHESTVVATISQRTCKSDLECKLWPNLQWGGSNHGTLRYADPIHAAGRSEN
jgi:hypothetical protein